MKLRILDPREQEPPPHNAANKRTSRRGCCVLCSIGRTRKQRKEGAKGGHFIHKYFFNLNIRTYHHHHHHYTFLIFSALVYTNNYYMRSSIILLLLLNFALTTTTCSAFAPGPIGKNGGVRCMDVALEMVHGERRAKMKRVVKGTAKKFAISLGTFALATSAIPPTTAHAAMNARTATTLAKDAHRISSSTIPLLFAAATSFGLGAVTTKVLARPDHQSSSSVSVSKINRVFRGAMPNQKLISSVTKILHKYGYNKKNTLLATSLCCDEVSRILEQDFSKAYNNNFSMGGLAGFPFGGMTAFGAMAGHIPDNGSALIVFGPHVGVDQDGYVGSVKRRGRSIGGACCGSAMAAFNYVQDVYRNETESVLPSVDPLDAQQKLVGNMLLPHAKRLDRATEKMVELPYALYDAQKQLMDQIVKNGATNVAGEGKIVVLGGIEINTPPGKSDYFLPLSFEVFDNKGQYVEDLLPSLSTSGSAAATSSH